MPSVFHPDQWAARFAHLAKFPWREMDAPPGYPHRIAVCFGQAENGRLVVAGLLIDPSENVEVPARLLRDLKPLTYARRAARDDRLLFPQGHLGRPARHRVRTKHPGRTGYSNDVYKRFAEDWIEAERTHPRTPGIRVMAVTGLSESTIYERKRRCIELGLLEAKKTSTSRRSPGRKRRKA